MIAATDLGHIIVRLDEPTWGDVPNRLKDSFADAIAELQHAHCDHCTFSAYEGSRGGVVLSVPVEAAFMTQHAVRIALIMAKESRLWRERSGQHKG